MNVPSRDTLRDGMWSAPSRVLALACLLAVACVGETRERPMQSTSDARATASAASSPAAPLFASAFTSDGAPAAPSSPTPAPRARFETRRIGADERAAGPRYRGAPIDLDVKSADLADVFRLLAEVGHVNIVVAGEVTGTITLGLKRVPWDQALDVIARAKDLAIERDGDVIVVRKR
jgi:type IV pilus assembly protein PilQ